MKWVAVSVAAGCAVAHANALQMPPLDVVARKVARRLQTSDAEAAFTSAIMSCIFAEPCASDGCLSAAGIAQSDLCSGTIGDFGTAVNPESCDGDSMGVAALMVNGTLSDTVTAAVCTSARADPVMSQCVVPTSATLQSLVRTMDANKDGACQNFTLILAGMLSEEGGGDEGGDDEEGEDFNATVAYSVEQGQVISATASGLISSMTNATHATAADAALAALNLTWADFFAPAFGLLPVTDPAELGATCFASAVATAGIGSDMTALAMAATLLGDSPPDATAIQTFLLDNYVEDATANFIASVASNDGFPDALVESFTHFVLFENVSRDDIDNATDVFEAHCTGSENTDCVADTAALVNETLTGIPAGIQGALFTLPVAVFFTTFEAYMATCAGMTSAAGYWIKGLDLYMNGGSDSPTDEQMNFVQQTGLVASCGLVSASLVDNTDPSRVNMLSCYQLSLFNAANDDVLAALMQGGLSVDAILTLEDSVPTLIDRCDAASVGLLPTPAPTVATGQPTQREINAAGKHAGAALLAAAALAAAALL